MALRATLLNRTDVAELCQVLTNAGLELVRFTIALRPYAAQLVDRYSERKEAGGSVNPAIDLSSIAIAPKATSS